MSPEVREWKDWADGTIRQLTKTCEKLKTQLARAQKSAAPTTAPAPLPVPASAPAPAPAPKKPKSHTSPPVVEIETARISALEEIIGGVDRPAAGISDDDNDDDASPAPRAEDEAEAEAEVNDDADEEDDDVEDVIAAEIAALQ
jgi:hypothetical protein